MEGLFLRDFWGFNIIVVSIRGSFKQVLSFSVELELTHSVSYQKLLNSPCLWWQRSYLKSKELPFYQPSSSSLYTHHSSLNTGQDQTQITGILTYKPLHVHLLLHLNYKNKTYQPTSCNLLLFKFMFLNSCEVSSCIESPTSH